MSRGNSPRRARRRPQAARVILVVVVAALLVGCGKKGNTIPPPGEPNTYPQTYPKQ